jgi:hypothetical protein
MSDHDDDVTPAHRGPALSSEAISLLEVALSLNGVASNLREVARVLDESEEAARRAIRVELDFKLSEAGRLCLEAAAALRVW